MEIITLRLTAGLQSIYIEYPCQKVAFCMWPNSCSYSDRPFATENSALFLVQSFRQIKNKKSVPRQTKIHSYL